MGCTITATAQDATTHCIVNRPSWSNMSTYYQYLADNFTTYNLFEAIFEAPVDHLLWNNSCGTRVSLTLINAGIKDNIIGRGVKIQKGEFTKRTMEPAADRLADWLKSKWGAPEVQFETTTTTTLKDLRDKIGSRKGVFAFKVNDRRAFGASGHITLWNGSNVISGSQYENQAYANGNPGEVLFWELK